MLIAIWWVSVRFLAYNVQDEMECDVMMHDSAYASFALPSLLAKSSVA